MPARTVILIRHAESEWNARGLWQGAAEVDLSARGRREAEALARSLPFTHIDALLASPQRRALDTASPIATRYGIDMSVDDDLRELDVGTWSGKSRAQIAAEDPGALDLFFRGIKGWEGGETYEQHETRARRAAERIASMQCEVCVVVTHGGTLRAIVLALLGLDPDLRWRLGGAAHGALARLVHGAHGYRLASYNEQLPGLASLVPDEERL